MSITIKRVTPPGTRPEKHYRVADVARAVGHTIGSVSNYINQELKRKVETGMSLEEVVNFLEGPRRSDPRSQYDIDTVVTIRRRLYEEFGILIEEEPIPDFKDNPDTTINIKDIPLFKVNS